MPSKSHLLHRCTSLSYESPSHELPSEGVPVGLASGEESPLPHTRSHTFLITSSQKAQNCFRFLVLFQSLAELGPTPHPKVLAIPDPARPTLQRQNGASVRYAVATRAGPHGPGQLLLRAEPFASHWAPRPPRPPPPPGPRPHARHLSLGGPLASGRSPPPLVRPAAAVPRRGIGRGG